MIYLYNQLPYGSIAIENGQIMMIFHSCVKLPEGNSSQQILWVADIIRVWVLDGNQVLGFLGHWTLVFRFNMWRPEWWIFPGESLKFSTWYTHFLNDQFPVFWSSIKWYLIYVPLPVVFETGLISVVMADPPWDIHMELLGKLRFRLLVLGMDTNTPEKRGI